MKEGGEEWQFQKYSGNLLLSFKRYFGKEAEVDVPMNMEAEEVVIITAGQDVGELGAWAQVMSAAVGPGKVAEMLRVACAEEGLPADVKGLVQEVYGKVAPDRVPQAQAYLWKEGVRSFRWVLYAYALPKTSSRANFCLHALRAHAMPYQNPPSI